MANTRRKFAKLCCGGNDFIIIDSRDRNQPSKPELFARRICDRRSGIGADGLIFLLRDEKHPFRIQLINADGSGAEVSYNGSRCVGRYAVSSGITSERFEFNSDAGPIRVKADGKVVTLWVPPPDEYQLNMRLNQSEEQVLAHYIKAGVPYVIINHSDLGSDWVNSVPPLIRTHPVFPMGTNVAVFKKVDEKVLKARFFERGVEEETHSSGSGCVAVSLIANLLWEMKSPVLVETKGGDFEIRFERRGNEFEKIRTSGEVTFSFTGEMIDI